MDEIDLGQEREQLDRELALRAALERAAEQDEACTNIGYGACTDCGQAIDPRRLAIKPHAARCVECQGRWEKQWVARHWI